MITATNKATGELIELPTDTPEQIVSAWRIAQEYVKAATDLKEQLKKLVPEMLGGKTTSEPIGDFMFRVSNIQRRTYDKSVMRQVFDADTFDLLLKPDKPMVDKYLKEHLEDLGELSSKLRDSMIDEGKPYEVIKLERLTRE
jgi:hypothetical protein